MKAKSVILRLACLSVLITLGYSLSEEPVVTVKNGTLVGTIMKARKGREYAGFRGIPYALPPLGELRFKVRLHFSILPNYQGQVSPDSFLRIPKICLHQLQLSCK